MEFGFGFTGSSAVPRGKLTLTGQGQAGGQLQGPWSETVMVRCQLEADLLPGSNSSLTTCGYLSETNQDLLSSFHIAYLLYIYI